MEQVQTQAPQRRELIDASVAFYQDLLGYKPEETSLKQIPESEWNEFIVKNGLNPNSSGIYLPRNQTAIIPKANILSLFHEYFGHGLYCEQSLSGRKLVDLEKRLLEEEKQEFSNSRFTLEDVKIFRQQNQTFQKLEEFRQQNLAQYETFAIWTEYLLSGEYNLREQFEKRYDSFDREDKEIIDSVINFSEIYGNLATFYEFGLGKVQNKERLLKLSKEIFDNKLNETNLILHFGSGKSFSDIDLFIISDDIKPSYCHWLDVRAYNSKDTEEKIRLLDSRVTDPLIVGNLIFGDERYLSELKEKILAQPITDEAIKHNLEMAKYSKKRSLDSSLGEPLQAKNLRSSKIYLTNALAMKEGKKLLTYKNIKGYVQKRLSHSEKFIELKGGIE